MQVARKANWFGPVNVRHSLFQNVQLSLVLKILVNYYMCL
uniref:Uncharacterized protein n=1 Tax=Arundo donax TaxID=35708 RepID=A0A0A8Y5F2_ARUDO